MVGRLYHRPEGCWYRFDNRSPPSSPACSGHAARKWTHLALQTAALALSIAGLVAIVQGKQFTSSKHMYSVHAWCGAVTLFLFVIQVRLSGD